MARALTMTMSTPGVDLSINYNAANLRITTIDWAVPQSGIVAWARIWDAGALVYDRTIAGPASGNENVPGNNRMVEATIDGAPALVLPANLTWIINIEKIGS